MAAHTQTSQPPAVKQIQQDSDETPWRQANNPELRTGRITAVPIICLNTLLNIDEHTKYNSVCFKLGINYSDSKQSVGQKFSN